jgi:folate-binding Fe-S cluster repair protein YgfZ
MNISSSDSIIQISGVDSAEFLQGQITNDINFASESKMTISAICNVKGRIIAVFKILKII